MVVVDLSQSEKSMQQKWFVLDPLHMLVAVPDKQHLKNGRLLSVAPLFSTTAHTDPTNRRQLVVRCCSDGAVGLMDPIPRDELTPSQEAQAALRCSRRARATWWKLVLLFEKEACCVQALTHINSRQASLREECRSNFFSELFSASPTSISADDDDGDGDSSGGAAIYTRPVPKLPASEYLNGIVRSEVTMA